MPANANCRLRAMIPQAGPEEVAGNRFALPGVAADHEGAGRVHRLLDRGRVRPRSAFAPADQPVVRRQPHDRVRHPAARDAAADLVVEIGDAHRPGVEANDFHWLAARPGLGACPIEPAPQLTGEVLESQTGSRASRVLESPRSGRSSRRITVEALAILVLPEAPRLDEHHPSPMHPRQDRGRTNGSAPAVPCLRCLSKNVTAARRVSGVRISGP